MHRKVILLLPLVWLCLPLTSFSKIAVVLSRAFTPYEQVRQKIETEWSEKPENYNLGGDADKGKLIMQALSNGQTDLIITIGWEATMAAKQSRFEIPVVYTMLLEKTDLPGKIYSGVVIQPDVMQQFKIIKQLIPNCKTIGIVYDAYSSSGKINEARVTAGKLGMGLMAISVSSSSDIPEVLAKLTRDRVDAIWSVVDPTVSKPEAVMRIIQHGLEQKIPYFAITQSHVEAGAYGAISISYPEIGSQTVELAKKVLQNKSSQPVETPRELAVFINAKTSRILGLNPAANLEGVKIIETQK